MTKNILVATSGLIPNVIAESFYVLSVQKRIHIDEIFAMASLSGSEIIDKGNPRHKTPPLFGDNGVIADLCTEYELKLPVMRRVVIQDANHHPVEDVVSDLQIEAAANTIVSNIKELTRDPDTTLHCVYSGGRRIMAISLGLALTLMARKNDFFYYMRIEPESILKQPNFFYPSKNNKTVDARIILNEIPILRLGEKYSSIMPHGTSYSETVLSIQKAISISKPAITVNSKSTDELVFEDTILKKEIGKLDKWSRLEIPDMNILLYGERGTGKEGIAQYFYNECRKENKSVRNIVIVNSASFVETTIGPELFGTKRGKWTGVEDSVGLIEKAENGVLFLDEFHHLDFTLQPKLLRLLEYREFQKIGDTTIRKLNNVRIILGMNEKPEDLLEREELRWDLFDRINRRISVPALRHRTDFESIVKCLIRKTGYKLNKEVTSVSPDVLQKLKQYRWGGNIRELKNLLEETIEDLDPNEKIIMNLPPDFISSLDRFSKLHSTEKATQTTSKPISTLDTAIREHIELALQNCDFNTTKSATVLGMKRTTLQAKMKKLNMSLPK